MFANLTIMPMIWLDKMTRWYLSLQCKHVHAGYSVAVETRAHLSLRMTFKWLESNMEWSSGHHSSGRALLRCTIPSYTTVSKGLVWKDPMVQINCITLKSPPVVYCGIGSILRWYGLCRDFGDIIKIYDDISFLLVLISSYPSSDSSSSHI
jgi:hypothetical protein